MFERFRVKKSDSSLTNIGKEVKYVRLIDEEVDDAVVDEKEQKTNKPSLEENTYFESYLAITLAKRKDLFPVVDKMTSYIIYAIDNYRNELKQVLNNKLIFQDVSDALYSNDFGMLGELSGKKKKPDNLLNDIKAALMDKKKFLINIIPIHFIFNFRLFAHVAADRYQQILSEYGKVEKYLHETKAHVYRKREEDVQPTSQIGLSRFPDVCMKINALPETAEIKKIIKLPYIKTSFERFIINPGDKLHKFYINNAPIVAGPSTHTLITIAAAKTIAPKLTDEEIREYALAYFVFTGCAGYHTFHEVMFIANKCLNRPYDMSNYIDNLPGTLKQSDYIAQLKKQFPDQLCPASKKYTGKPDPTLFLTNLVSHQNSSKKQVMIDESKIKSVVKYSK